MAKKSLKEISRKMKDLDYCMLTTVTSGGKVASRPMSNNRQVDYDGDSYFFTSEDTRIVKDVRKNANVNLGFEGKKNLFISIEGKPKLVKSKSRFEEHWTPDLDRWFEDGVDTKGLVMVHVKAKRIKYWQDEEEGEVSL